MVNIQLYLYICFICLILNVVFLIKDRLKKEVYIINSLLLLIISNFSIWNGGIIADQFNTSGRTSDFVINILNIAIFLLGLSLYEFYLKNNNKSN